MILTPADLARCSEIANGPALVHAIIAEVAQHTGFTPTEIIGARRWANLAAARQLVYFIANERGVTFAQIGLAMNRDTSTVIHGVNAEQARRGE
jgi:chromosomal replication initiation ATPase DnaA